MQKLSFFHFIQNTLFHPIQFTDTYFEEENSPVPYLRKYAWRSYIGLSIVNSLLGIGSMKKGDDMAVLLILFPLFIAFIYLITLIGYLFFRWFLKKALHLSKATIPEKRMEEIALYLLLVSILFSTCLSIVKNILVVGLSLAASYVNLGDHVLTALGVMYILLSLAGFIYIVYMCYKIIAKTTGVNPLKVIVWYVALHLLGVIAMLLGFALIFFIVMIFGAIAR